MFKINIYLKLALTVLLLGGGIILGIIYSFWYSFVLILIGLVLLASYFLLGTIQSSAEKLQTQDFAGAEKQLNLTLFPNLLYVTNRAIYYVLKGTIESQKKNNAEAEILLNKALSLKLPSDNEKAMVLLQLANINMGKSNWAGAKSQVNQLKKLKISEKMIKEQIDMFEKALDNRGQMNVARSMGKQGMQMMQGGYGSKRRRPKMR
jgi:tetratricopeptide (TPR) repeat protein